MSAMDYKQRLIATAAMYGKSMSPFEIGVWEDALKNYEEAQIARALESHIKNPDNGQFMPKVADIVRLIDGDSQDRAHIAWQKAFEGISSVGQYEDVCFDDGHIHSVIEEMGGWEKFCLMTTDEISFRQRDFINLYKTNSRHNKPYPKLLIGTAGAQNRLTGRKVAPPVPIGDTEQCRLTYKNGGGYRQATGGNLLSDVTAKLVQKEAAQ